MAGESNSGESNGQAPDDSTAGQAPAANTAQAAGTSTSQADDAQQTSQTDSATPLTASELAALRRENAQYRTRLKALEKAQSDAQAASLTELERAQRRVAELEAHEAEAVTREQDRNVRLSAVEEAVKLNFRSPDLAYRLVDRSDVEFDESNTPKNVGKLLKAIIEKDPYLAKGSGADFGGGNRGGAPASVDMNKLIRGAAGRN